MSEEKKRFPWWTLFVMGICIAALVYVWHYADTRITEYERFAEMRKEVDRDTYYPGIYVDGVPLNGLTREEAYQQISGLREADVSEFGVTVSAGETRMEITAAQADVNWNAEEILAQAWRVGRSGTLEERYTAVCALEEKPALFETTLSYSREAVRAMTDTFARAMTQECINAQVTAFDMTNRTFTFTDEQYGRAVDADLLYERVIAVLDSEMYGTEIVADVQETVPEVTRAQLENQYRMVSKFSTVTTDDKNRNTNIRLAADALNGRVIEPGGTISFNEVTGQRTRDKGYLEAGAIAGGQSIKEVGGGVCQVSTTLFNAMIRGGGSIVTRYAHAWPSDYVPRGEDATVNWPSVDLVMRNDTAAPMFILAWYSDRVVTVEIYGLARQDGMTCDLYSETVYVSEPTEEEAIYTLNPELPKGTTKLVRKPHTGYSVETYFVWYKDGVEVSREHAFTTHYGKIVKEYEYNE